MPLVEVTAADDRSAACDANDHDRCSHIVAGGEHLWRSRQARAKPRSFLERCPCSCHDACPVTTTAPADDLTLYAACTCTDRSELVERRQARRQGKDTQQRLRQEAVQAVLSKADGQLGKDQARAALQTELAGRGVRVSEWQLDIFADTVVASQRTHGRNLAVLRVAFRIHKRTGQTLWRLLREPRRE